MGSCGLAFLHGSPQWSDSGILTSRQITHLIHGPKGRSEHRSPSTDQACMPPRTTAKSSTWRSWCRSYRILATGSSICTRHGQEWQLPLQLVGQLSRGDTLCHLDLVSKAMSIIHAPRHAFPRPSHTWRRSPAVRSRISSPEYVNARRSPHIVFR